MGQGWSDVWSQAGCQALQFTLCQTPGVLFSFTGAMGLCLWLLGLGVPS